MTNPGAAGKFATSFRSVERRMVKGANPRCLQPSENSVTQRSSARNSENPRPFRKQDSSRSKKKSKRRDSGFALGKIPGSLFITFFPFPYSCTSNGGRTGRGSTIPSYSTNPSTPAIPPSIESRPFPSSHDPETNHGYHISGRVHS